MDFLGMLALMEVNDLRSNGASSSFYNVKNFGAVGDGVNDDSSAINAVFAKIKSEGKFSVVYLPKGTYKINSYLKMPSNTTLLLDRNATLIRGVSTLDSILMNDSDGTIGGYNANANMSVIGGIFDGNSAFSTVCTLLTFAHSTNINIEDVTFQNLFDWHMTEINSSQDVRIAKCTYKNYGINGSANATEMLQLDLAASSAAFPWFGPYDNTPCKNVSIERCNFYDGVRAIGSHTATSGYSHSDIRILNNHFERMKQEAIHPYNWDNVNISNNSFNQTYFGIYAIPYGTNKNYKVNGNTLTNINYDGTGTPNTNSRGIYFGGSKGGSTFINCIVKDNNLDVIGRHGMGADYCFNFTFANNTIRGCNNAGIWLYGTAKSNVVGNILDGNNLSAAANTADITVGMASAQNDTVRNNIIGNNCETMYIGTSYITLIQGNVVANANGLAWNTSMTSSFMRIRQCWNGGSFIETTDL